jgi:hypothetical protein
MTRALWLCLMLPAGAAFAGESVPDFFVPESECKPRQCTCEDAPLTELMLRTQTDAKSAWQSVKDDVLKGTGPKTGQEAISLFQSRFSGDSRISDQFTACPDYDPEVNSVSKIAGVSPFGEARLDPCFCQQFCSDVVQATIAHERMHVPTILAGVLSKGDSLIGCKLGLMPKALCDTVAPLTLTDSELLSHQVGMDFLSASLRRMRTLPDPNDPSIKCTWDTLTVAAASSREPLPTTWLGRVTVLVGQLVHSVIP